MFVYYFLHLDFRFFATQYWRTVCLLYTYIVMKSILFLFELEASVVQLLLPHLLVEQILKV